jgi:hypothetical protein
MPDPTDWALIRDNRGHRQTGPSRHHSGQAAALRPSGAPLRGPAARLLMLPGALSARTSSEVWVLDLSP